MTMKSIKTCTRLLTCLVVLAVVFATFLAGTFTSQASEDVFGDIELKVGDTLGFVYYTSQPYTSNTTMRFSINGRTSTSPAYPNDGKCVFIFNDIYPHEIAQEVTATIVVNNKDVVTSTGLSVKEYLLKMLLNPKSTAAETQFASDTLQYCEQTRLYRNLFVAESEKNNESITDDINTSIYTKYKPQNIQANMPGSASGLGVSASNIRMSSIGISYHNTNRYVVTLQMPTGSQSNPNNIKVVIGNKEYTPEQNEQGVFQVQSEPISAYDLMENANTPKNTEFKLYVNGKIVQQASYNIMDYIYQLQDTATDTPLALMYARSLYRYAQSAKAAYKGNRIVSIALKTNPSDITPSSQNAHTPLGGSITAYYADGTSKVISEGIVWSNKDINGNDVKITGETYTKSYTVIGSYKDPVSNKTYTVTGTATLVNPMTSIAVYSYPSTYAPTTYKSSYTPKNSVVTCTWANKYTANHTPTHSAINMADYQTDEYGFIPTTASYTDTNSKVTKTIQMYQYYSNPIKSIAITNSTATFNGSTSAKPASSSYTVTFTNGKTLSKTTGTTSWTYTYKDGVNGDKTATYTFGYTNVTYTGTNITATLESTGTLACPTFGSWTTYKDGKTSTVGATARNVTDAFSVTASNPEKTLTITAAPSIKGGTVTSTSAPTGSTGSTTNGQFTGGTVVMTYGNTKTENVSASFTSSAGITDTAYSKSVTVTASYTGKAGGAWSDTETVTIYNTLKGVAQRSTPTILAASTTNTQLTLANTKNTLTATYNNGKTATVGDGTSTTTNIYLNGTNRNTACWVESISTNTVTTATRTTAGASNSTTSRYSIKVVYTDTRSGSNKATAEIAAYSVTVKNTYASISTTSTSAVYMTGANATPKPTDAVTIVLSNGKTMTHSSPTYGQPTSITDATEYADRTISVSATATDGTTVSRNVTCRVINKPKSAAKHTNPTSKVVSNQSQYPASSVSGGKLTVTFTNGATATKDCTSYATTASTKLTGTTASGTFDITGYYAGSYATVSATLQLTLTNTPKSATYSPNSITLSSSGQKPSGTLAVTYDNGYVENHTVTSSTTIYSSGTDSNSGATTKTSGTCYVTASKTVAGESMSATGTCSWSNPLKSISDNGGANRNCADAGKTITMSNSYVNGESVKATYTNGATKNVEPKLPGNEWDNASGTSTITYSVPVSYTDGGVTKTCNITVTIYVPLSSISTSAKTATFSSTEVSTSISTVIGTYKNGKTASLTPTLSVIINGNSSSTISISGTTVKCTYSGTDYAKWSSAITATAGGKSCTVPINYVNTPTMETYTSQSTSGTKVNNITGGAASTYGKVYFNGGSCYTESSYGSIYGYVKFKNGKGKWVTPGNGATLTDFSHTGYLQYKNGKSFSATIGTNGSLSAATLTYSISATYNAGTAASCTDSFYIYTLTSNYGYYYVPQEIRLEAGDDMDHINAEDWEAYHDIYYFGKNRTTSGTPSSSRNGGYYDQFAWTATGLTNSTTYKGGVYSSSSAKVASSNISSSSSWYIYGSGNIARTEAGNPLIGAGWYGNDYYLAAYLTTKLYSSTLGNVYAMNGGYWSYACSIEEMGY